MFDRILNMALSVIHQCNQRKSHAIYWNIPCMNVTFYSPGAISETQSTFTFQANIFQSFTGLCLYGKLGSS